VGLKKEIKCLQRQRGTCLKGETTEPEDYAGPTGKFLVREPKDERDNRVFITFLEDVGLSQVIKQEGKRALKIESQDL